MSSTRIKGAALALSFGGTEFWADAKSVVLDNEETASGGATTFEDVANGGSRTYFFTIGAIQSTAAGSFWRYVWANSGAHVAYRYAPHGNTVADADKPHFLGTVIVGPKPVIGGEAGKSNEFTFEVRFDVEGEPTLDLGAGADPVITSVSPAGRAVGQSVLIAGTRFTAVSDVKFGTVSASSIIAVSDTTITAVIPAGTGVKAVTVITPEGVSAPVNYTVA